MWPARCGGNRIWRATLEAIAKGGPEAFYKGAFAADMAGKVQDHGRPLERG
jgi:gamma-glutamyltranspeptidase